MLQAAQRNDALAQLPVGIPDAIPKTNGLANTAGLTSAEIAKRDLAGKEKAERAAIAAALKLTKARKPASRAVPAPTAPAPGPIDLTGLGDDEEDAGLPPPFTALPRLEDTAVMKRTRGKTLDFVALQNGTATKKRKA